MQTELNYLTPPFGAFWQWNEQGQVLSSQLGSTIAFRPELRLVLEQFEHSGLPRLNAIVLLLAAMRDSWPETRCTLEPWFQSLPKSIDQGAKKLLDRVAEFPADVRHPTDAKIAMVNLVCGDVVRCTSPQTATDVLEQLSFGWSVGETLPEDQTVWHSVATKDLQLLLPGLKRVSPDKIRQLMETGIEELPLAAPIEPPEESQTIAELLLQLRDDDELAGLARLAEQMMATVSLPRAVQDRDELQLGGVSDISNRGPLDRLLISELAYDDLTLAVRISENEALYLRRESPPRTPPQQRSILLESGIRTWGTPRVFAAAVALALAAIAEKHAHENMTVQVYRAEGADVETVDLSTRSGLLAHLGALQSDLHPGDALDAFSQKIAQQVSGDESAASPVLVMSADVWEDPKFQRALAESPLTSCYIATVNGEGNFRLLQRTPRGGKQIKEAKLDLRTLVKRPDRIRKNQPDGDALDLPAIFSTNEFPLLLSTSAHPNSWPSGGIGLFTLTGDRRLLWWTGKDRGATQLAIDMPKGKVFWYSPTVHDGVSQAIIGREGESVLHLIEIDLSHLTCSQQSIDVKAGFLTIASCRDVLFAIYPREVLVFEKDSGEKLQRMPLPSGVGWRHDCYFNGPENGCWYVLTHNGQTAVLTMFYKERVANAPKILEFFSQPDIEGPVGVTTEGGLYETGTETLKPLQLKGEFEVHHIDPDGRQVLLQCTGPKPGGYPYFSLNTVTGDTNCQYWPFTQTSQRIDQFVNEVGLRNRFKSIGVNASGNIVLSSRKGQRLELALLGSKTIENAQLKFYDAAQLTSYREPTTTVEFTRLISPFGFRLYRATWNDGSIAVLDSRGMLHLRSANASIPEISIVLREIEVPVAGWCSNGDMWGNPYHLSKAANISPREIVENVIKPFGELLS